MIRVSRAAAGRSPGRGTLSLPPSVKRVVGRVGEQSEPGWGAYSV